MEPQFGLIILLQNFFLQNGLWIIMELKENLHEFKIDIISGELGILKGIVLFSC